MTFPQSDSRQAVLNGQEFFRLQTALVSPGDIYESEVSALATVVGPDSDLATYRISYFDSISPSPGSVNQVIVTPDRDIIGRIDARMDAIYPGAGSRRGRILASVADIYDTSWRPTSFIDGTDVIYFEPANIDLLFYLVNPPAITPQRSDRLFRYQYFSSPAAGGTSWVVIPGFGRKSGYFTVDHDGGVPGTTDVEIHGIIFSTSAAPGVNGTVQRKLFASANFDDAAFIYKSSNSKNIAGTEPTADPIGGLYDAFAIAFLDYGGEAIATTVTLSDDPL